MKIVLSLFLALVICLSLCACGTSDDGLELPAENISPVEIEEAKSDMYGVSYEGPGELANEGKEDKEDKQVNIENIDFNGVWIETESGATLVFFDDPIGKAIKITTADGKRSNIHYGWVLDGAYIKFPYQDDIIILVEGNNDTIQLKYNEGTYIRESDYYASTDTLKLGETIITDSTEFTLNTLSFVDEVDPSTLTPSSNGGLSTSPDMCFAYLSFHLKNISKTAFNVGEYLDITIDYNNGYIFEMKGDKYSYLGIPNSTINRKITRHASSGSLLSLSPLTGEEYILLIPCADVIPNNNTNPLNIFVSIPTNQGHKTFIYKIQ